MVRKYAIRIKIEIAQRCAEISTENNSPFVCFYRFDADVLVDFVSITRLGFGSAHKINPYFRLFLASGQSSLK